MDRLEVLLWIAGAGAFGGFVDGLLFPRTYEFRVGRTTRDLGSIGDALVGSTAAVAIFAVAGAVFNLEVANLQATDEFLKLVAWGVLSGFGGLRVLRPLSDKLVMEVAGKAAREAVEKASVQTREASVHIQAGEALLTKYDFTRRNPEFAKGRAGELEDFLNVAENKFKAALAADPENADALRGQAKVLKRRAFALEGHSPARRRELIETAEATLSRVVERNPEYAPGYYSRACYRNLLGGVRGEVIDDLREAFRLNPALRELAETDPDLDSVRGTPEYRELAGPRPATTPPPSTASGSRSRRRPRSTVG